jgi:hypothetical protein
MASELRYSPCAVVNRKFSLHNGVLTLSLPSHELSTADAAALVTAIDTHPIRRIVYRSGKKRYRSSMNDALMRRASIESVTTCVASSHVVVFLTSMLRRKHSIINHVSADLGFENNAGHACVSKLREAIGASRTLTTLQVNKLESDAIDEWCDGENCGR